MAKASDCGKFTVMGVPGPAWSRVVPCQKHPAPGINELTKALKETKVFTKVFTTVFTKVFTKVFTTTKDGDFANVPLNQL